MWRHATPLPPKRKMPWLILSWIHFLDMKSFCASFERARMLRTFFLSHCSYLRTDKVTPLVGPYCQQLEPTFGKVRLLDGRRPRWLEHHMFRSHSIALLVHPRLLRTRQICCFLCWWLRMWCGIPSLSCSTSDCLDFVPQTFVGSWSTFVWFFPFHHHHTMWNWFRLRYNDEYSRFHEPVRLDWRLLSLFVQ